MKKQKCQDSMNPKSSISFNCSNKTSETLKIELNTIFKVSDVLFDS